MNALSTSSDRRHSTVTETLATTPRGSKSQGRISVGQTATGQTLDIPFMVAKGTRPGPTLWINGAVHGEELNGVLAAMDFYQAIEVAALAGNLVVTPTSNYLAVDNRTKTASLDLLDMDQQFPGNKDGQITQRSAYHLFTDVAPHADVALNLHTHGTQYSSLPYGVYKAHPDSSMTEAGLLGLISCFAPTLACLMPVDNAPGELPGNIAGALDYQLLIRGKAAFMMEMGGGGREEPENVAATLRGLVNLCTALGMIHTSNALATKGGPMGDSLRQVTQRKHVFSSHGGFFRAAARPGDMVAAGHLIGVSHDVFGNVLEEVRLEHDCIIIGIRTNPILHTGDRICFIGKEWREMTVGRSEVASFAARFRH